MVPVAFGRRASYTDTDVQLVNDKRGKERSDILRKREEAGRLGIMHEPARRRGIRRV